MNQFEIFLAAVEIADFEKRAEYVRTACGDDAALRLRIEALLSAHDRSGEFLDVPALEQAKATVDETKIDGERSDGSIDLSFLEPSPSPGSLGRLGQLEMLELIGRGGFGIVFRAFDESLQRMVAVKVLAPELAATSPARKRFLREARAAAQVRHENVVQVHAVIDRPTPHLVMEFIPGETLQQRLDRTGPLDVAEIVGVGRQIAQGLAAAHAQGLIHRDVKPSNILIDGGAGGKAKITDFGLARAADDASLTQSGVVSGTPLYMAPEQAGGLPVDHRSDLFSLGSVLYAITTGRPPFRAPSTTIVLRRVREDLARPIREVIPETPEWLCRIVETLHAKDPGKRFPSAAEVADLLADCEAQLTLHAEVRDLKRVPAASRPTPGRRIAWIATTAVLCVVAAIAAAMHSRSGGGPAPDVDASTRAEVRASLEFDSKAGWIRLFDGEGFAGWRPFAPAGAWRVTPDKTLVGAGRGYLLTREEFGDFRLVAEVRIGDGGDSGVLFRCDPASLDSRRPRLMEATINSTVQGNPATGSLTTLDAVFQYGKNPHLPPNEWFTFEVAVERNRISVRANGTTLLEGAVGAALPNRGVIGLQCPGNNASVEFRSIWILPMESAPRGKALKSP